MWAVVRFDQVWFELDHLEHGRECYERHEWGDQSLLRADQAAALRADDLERLATAAYLIGRDLDFQRIQERLTYG